MTTQYVGEADHCDAVALVTNGQLAALAAPEDLRRVAMGGDVLEVQTTHDFDVAQLPRIEGILDVRPTGRRSFLVYCQDAGAATPEVLAAFRAAGGEVVSSREYRPSFDEIFTLLVERHQAAGQAAADATNVPVAPIPYISARPR